ncbi:sodium/glutamate symporter [Agrobacterium sp. OT33]|uniref:sodium/glutamate symporter n=1 Tax=Agrobacterium sp. OT33 TaxID=2815338 RepID=UPI001A9048AB|nr:sodium/glutamate symporter [Agrobacterium sp. OT33]MBO0128458.1 sodium/glutamate symporter [Agrobacterium sp. OT33]
MTIDPFVSFTIAVVLLLSGKILTMNVSLLRKYSIPEPVAGGFLCAGFIGIVYLVSGVKVSFQLDLRDFLLLLFFACIGLKSDVRTLLRGGAPLALLVVLAALFILLQNFTGMGIASAFGLDPNAGLITGSIALTGGVGTTLAWAPILVSEHGVGNALELGVAANTIGLITACTIGGPVAAYLIRRYAIEASGSDNLDVGTTHDDPNPRMDYFSVLWAILTLNVTVMLGLGIHAIIEQSSFTLPAFVSCLMAGILIRNVVPFAVGRTVLKFWPGVGEGLTLLSDISLGLFLTMALMSLQLWELQGVVLFITTVLAAQVLLTVAYIRLAVFPLMGRNYEAVVVSAGFGGITLGSTATAIANMTAVTQQYGAAHRAFIIVPLVCGFFIDIVNALLISTFLAWG